MCFIGHFNYKQVFKLFIGEYDEFIAENTVFISFFLRIAVFILIKIIHIM